MVFALQTDALTAVEVVKLLTPSVVHIATQIITMGMFNQAVPGGGVGTGIILDADGHVLTNNHVVQDAQQIIVTLNTGKSFQATIVGTDTNTDLAVIRIDASGLQPAKLGDSDALQVGEEVIAIGHALGLPGGPTVSKGVVSALGRSLDSDAQTTILDMIQTDASINPGNSGGALVNANAEVIGINTAIIEGGRGIGFAININDAKVVTAQLIQRGFVERGYLGIVPFNLIPAIASQLLLPEEVTEGVVIFSAPPGFPAAKAGLREGDVIVALGGEPIGNTGELSKFLLAHGPGETITVVIFRGPDQTEVFVTLAERPQR